MDFDELGLLMIFVVLLLISFFKKYIVKDNDQQNYDGNFFRFGNRSSDC